MNSAHISTSTSATMKSLMLSQKPLRIPGQLSLITSQLRKTLWSAPPFRKMLSTAEQEEPDRQPDADGHPEPLASEVALDPRVARAAARGRAGGL